MLFPAVFLFLFVTTQGVHLSPDEDKRIIGGKKPYIGDIRYMIAVVYLPSPDKPRFMCAGALISARTVVTSSVCFNIDLRNLQKFEIRASLEQWRVGAEVRGVKKLARHESATFPPGYDEKFPSNYADLSVVVVDAPFNEGTFRPLKLPQITDTIEIGEILVMAGWGRAHWEGWWPDAEYDISVTNELNLIELKVMDPEQCQKRMPWAVSLSLYMQMCTEPPTDNDVRPWTTCYGDFGNPLVRDFDTLLGVFAYQIELCHFYYPPVFQTISLYVDWIKANME